MTRRIFAILVLAGLIAAGAVADARIVRPRIAATPVSAGRLDRGAQPVAAPSSALSSTYYCIGAMSLPNLVSDARVVILNTGDTALSGTVTYQPSEGASVAVPVQAPAHTRVVLKPSAALKATYASATVELDGGQAAVEWVALGPYGSSTIPCTTGTSDTWYFAEGATTRDAIEAIVLNNPFPADAVVDLSFTTEDGHTSPESVTSLAV